MYRRLRGDRERLSSIAEGSVTDEPEGTRGDPLVGKGMMVLFIALIACFTAWGVAQDLTTPMVAGFKRIFDMSTFQASLVQLAYFVAYFAMAAGCSILETSANPYVISLGPEATATRRLNLAQAFNPVGTNIGVLLASTLI